MFLSNALPTAVPREQKTVVLITVLVLAAFAAIFLIRLLRKPAPAPQRPDNPAGRAAQRASAPLAAPPSPLAAAPAPPLTAGATGIVRKAQPQLESMLRDFQLLRASDLPPEEARAVGALLGRIPRPPSALQKLTSPDYLANARSAELGEMLMAEPQVAARVLAVVNSPLYGLKTPLASLPQAITFLGMNSVRGICLQYLMDASFRSDDPQLMRIFKGLWNGSTLASELCFKLAPMLELPEQGALVTQVVLSFLGPVASHSLLPKELVLTLRTRGLLERSRIEQERLGLCAAELGGLLLQQWQLPQSIIERVRAVDQVLLQPPDSLASAVCYLSARLGEKLVRNELADLADFSLAQEAGAEFFQLKTWLQEAGINRLQDCLQQPTLLASIRSMRHNLQGG